MIAIWLALAGAILNAVSKIVFRSVMRAEGNAWAVIILNNLLGAAIFIAVRGVPSFENVDGQIVFRILLGTCFWVLSSIGDIYSHRHLDAVVNSIFSGLRFATLALATMVIFGETLAPIGYVGILIILISIWASADFGSVKFRVGALYRVLALVTCNLSILNDRDLLTKVDPDLLIFCAFLLPGLVVSVLRPKDVFAIPIEIKRSRGWLVLVAAFQVLIYGFHVYATKLGGLLVTATLNQTHVVFTFILGVVILHERDHLWRRGVAALLCALGATLVSFAR